MDVLIDIEVCGDDGTPRTVQAKVSLEPDDDGIYVTLSVDGESCRLLDVAPAVRRSIGLEPDPPMLVTWTCARCQQSAAMIMAESTPLPRVRELIQEHHSGSISRTCDAVIDAIAIGPPNAPPRYPT